MSDQERGPYTPPSDRLAFDPRQPVRGGGPAPVTLIVSALVLLAIIGGIFLVYRGGIRHKGAPTAVGAPLADIRTPAPPADASNAAPAALVIDKSDTASNAAPAFAPPPEEPLPRPVASAAPPPAAPTPVVTQAPIVAAKPPPKPTTTPVAETAPAKPAKPLTIASLANDALENGPPVKPAKIAKPPTAAPALTAAAPTMAANATPAAGWVQIGAFSSAALANTGWHDVAKFAPDAMAGKGKQVQPLSLNGKTLYRAYVTGFRSKDAAEAFCAKLKAASKPCLVR
jgi:SPOR domain